MHFDPDVARNAEAHAQWVHALRNAANTAGVTLAMARRLLLRGDADGALDMIERCQDAWNQGRQLLDGAPAATRREDAPAHDAPRMHR